MIRQSDEEVLDAYLDQKEEGVEDALLLLVRYVRLVGFQEGLSAAKEEVEDV